MAAVFRTTRGEVSLAMSPSREEDDDVSTSPHLNTFIGSKAKSQSGETPVKDVTNSVPPLIGCINEPNYEINSGGEDQDTQSHVSGSDAIVPSFQPNINTCDPNEAVIPPSSIEQKDYISVKLSSHSRVPSAASSIPHLMGRLSFIGIDAELPSTLLDDSIVSSNDFDRFKSSASMINTVSPYPDQSHTTPFGHQVTQEPPIVSRFNDHYESSHLQMPSQVSESQSTTANKNNGTNTYNTPPYHLQRATANTLISPPHKVSQLALNTQPHQHLVKQMQYQLAPEIDLSSEPTCMKSIGIEQVSPLNGPSFEPERKSEPIPYHDRLRTNKQPIQPILYSAINSLERYNEGSFDNKILHAKAFARRNEGIAFSGALSKMPKKLTGSNDSATDSQSLASSSLNGEKLSLSKTVDTLQFRLDLSAAGEAKVMDAEVKEPMPANVEPTLKKVVRSQSSSNLSDGILNDKKESNQKDISDNRVIFGEGERPRRRKRREKKEKKIGVFRPTGDAYTPRMGGRPIKYKPAQERESVDKMSSTMGTIQRPNFRDALRRVAIILHQHIIKIEHRFETGIRGVDDTGLFKTSRRDEFCEDKFATPRYKCSMVRVPMACPGVVYSMRKIRVVYSTPTTDEIYDFAHQLFKKVQLSSECSIVCLIYVEKLMEVSKVPLVASTWRPIFMCGLLLASKVWQDLSSWNIEFASVYPQFSLEAINRLEVQFLKAIKWDLYISSR